MLAGIWPRQRQKASLSSQSRWVCHLCLWLVLPVSPGGSFRSLSLFLEGSPSLPSSLSSFPSVSPGGSSPGKWTGPRSRLSHFTGGRNPGAGGAETHGPRTFTSQSPAPAPRSADKTITFRGSRGGTGALCEAQRGVWRRVRALRYLPSEGHGRPAAPSPTGAWPPRAPPGTWASLWGRARRVLGATRCEMGGNRGQRERGREPGNRCLSEVARPHGVAAPPPPWRREPRAPPNGVVTRWCLFENIFLLDGVVTVCVPNSGCSFLNQNQTRGSGLGRGRLPVCL